MRFDPSPAPRERRITLPEIPEPRGNLTFIEERRHLPFDIGEVRWLRNALPHGGDGRLDAAIVAVTGRRRVVVEVSGRPSVTLLERATTALHVPPPMRWTIEGTGTGSLCLVLSGRTAGPFRTGHAIGPFDLASVDDAAVIPLPHEGPMGGGVTCVSSTLDVPFPVRRVYYLYDIPAGAQRGGHAHREMRQVLVAASGSFDVVLDDARRRRTVRLDRDDTGLFIPPGVWRELQNFAAGSVCLALASHPYDENDYVRMLDEFQMLKRVV